MNLDEYLEMLELGAAVTENPDSALLRHMEGGAQEKKKRSYKSFCLHLK